MGKWAAILAVGLLAMPAAEARNWTVNPGQSIQEAIDKAVTGDTVQVLPGQYPESIRIETPGLRVVGMSYEGERAALLGEGELSIGVTVAANDVTVEGFVIEGFVESGVKATGVSGLTLDGLSVHDSGHTHIDLESLTGAVVTGCVSRGGRLYGVRVYRSQEVRVADGEVSNSGTGIYLYESVQTMVENNTVFGNYRGIGVEGGGDPEHPAEYTKIFYNRIVRNDRNRTWAGSSEMTMTASYGIGVQVRNADYTEIAHNHIEENAWLGVLVQGSLGDGEDASLASSRTSDHTYVHHNRYADNGRAGSSESAGDTLPRGDIAYDGTGERNQFQEAQDLTTHPPDLVQRLGGVHTDVIHFL